MELLNSGLESILQRRAFTDIEGRWRIQSVLANYIRNGYDIWDWQVMNLFFERKEMFLLQTESRYWYWKLGQAGLPHGFDETNIALSTDVCRISADRRILSWLGGIIYCDPLCTPPTKFYHAIFGELMKQNWGPNDDVLITPHSDFQNKIRKITATHAGGVPVAELAARPRRHLRQIQIAELTLKGKSLLALALDVGPDDVMKRRAIRLLKARLVDSAPVTQFYTHN